MRADEVAVRGIGSTWRLKATMSASTPRLPRRFRADRLDPSSSPTSTTAPGGEKPPIIGFARASPPSASPARTRQREEPARIRHAGRADHPRLEPSIRQKVVLRRRSNGSWVPISRSVACFRHGCYCLRFTAEPHYVVKAKRPSHRQLYLRPARYGVTISRMSPFPNCWRPPRPGLSATTTRAAATAGLPAARAAARGREADRRRLPRLRFPRLCRDRTWRRNDFQWNSAAAFGCSAGPGP